MGTSMQERQIPRQSSSVALRDMSFGKDTDCEGDAEAESRASEDSIEEQQREEERLCSSEVATAGVEHHSGTITRSWDDCAAIQRSSPGLPGKGLFLRGRPLWLCNTVPRTRSPRMMRPVTMAAASRAESGADAKRALNRVAACCWSEN